MEFIKNHTSLKKNLIETFFTGTLYSAKIISYRGKTKLLALSSRVMSGMPDFKRLATTFP